MKNISKKMMYMLLVVSFLSCPIVLAEDAMEEMSDEPETKTLFGDYLKEKGVDVGFTGSLDLYDKYVWRGQYLDNDMVLQPGLTASVAGFSAGYWGSFDMENTDALSSDEADIWASYTYTIEMVSLTGGHTWYDFSETNTSTKEFFASVSVATILTPTVSFYHDYEDGKDLNTDGDGNYYVLSLAHSLPLCEEQGITLDLSSTFGYVDGQWLSGEGYHVTPKIGLTVPLTASLTAKPSIGYNIPFEDLEDPAIGNQDDKLFGGVSMAYTF